VFPESLAALLDESCEVVSAGGAGGADAVGCAAGGFVSGGCAVVLEVELLGDELPGDALVWLEAAGG
jgi:hypothetical protein